MRRCVTFQSKTKFLTNWFAVKRKLFRTSWWKPCKKSLLRTILILALSLISTQPTMYELSVSNLQRSNKNQRALVLIYNLIQIKTLLFPQSHLKNLLFIDVIRLRSFAVRCKESNLKIRALKKNYLIMLALPL